VRDPAERAIGLEHDGGDGLRLGCPARAQRRQDLLACDAFHPHGAFEKSAPVKKQRRLGLISVWNLGEPTESQATT
jgi:hypothetical protein